MCSKIESSTSSNKSLPSPSTNWLLKLFSSCKGILEVTVCSVADLFVSLLSRPLSRKCEFFETCFERIVTCSLSVECNPLTSCCSLLRVFCRALSSEFRDVCRILSSLSFSQRTLLLPWVRFNSRKLTFPWLAIFMLSMLRELLTLTLMAGRD